MSPLSLNVTGTASDFTVVIYQGNGAQLFWVEEDSFGLFLGPIESQGSLTGLPAVSRHLPKDQVKRKH